MAVPMLSQGTKCWTFGTKERRKIEAAEIIF